MQQDIEGITWNSIQKHLNTFRYALYTTFIRPHLEYDNKAWGSYLLKDVEALESVQKFALRACCKKWVPYMMNRKAVYSYKGDFFQVWMHRIVSKWKSCISHNDIIRTGGFEVL